MFRILATCCALFTITLQINAMEIYTSINDVNHVGVRELGGFINMRVDFDEFAPATPEQPLFVRIRFDKNAVLGSTLVDINSNDPAVNQPIYLAMRLESTQGSTAVLTAPADTLSIARWVMGEPDIWIRIKHGSSEWISDNGVPVPPTTSRLVTWWLGASARLSFDTTGSFPDSQRNLPYNTRNLQATGDPSDAVSTLLCVDLSTSALQVDTLLETDFVFFRHTVEISPGVFPANGGDVYGISPFGDFHVARGKERFCTVLDLMDANPVAQGPVTEAPYSFVDSVMRFRLDCESGGNFLFSPLVNGSWLMLETNPDLGVGFEPGHISFVGSDAANTSPGVEVVDPESQFTRDGRTLYSRIFLYWDSGSHGTSNFDVEVAVRTLFPLEHQLENPVVDWSWNLLNHSGGRDAPPFDGPDQYWGCEPAPFEAGSGSHTFALSIPTLGQWGLILFCTLLAGSGMWMMRRRRLA